MTIPEMARGAREDSEGITLPPKQTGRMFTLESIFERANKNLAYKRVVANKGSAGVDGMEVGTLLEYLREHGSALVMSVKEGSYKPQPVLRIYIPKEAKGEFRPLGIPSVRDRWVQQCVAQKLSEAYEGVYSDNSHGFRPNRSCHTALKQSLENANAGYRWVVDLDIAKFFDTVNHSKLLQLLSERIRDGRVISLIHKFLRAPVQEGRKEELNKVGTPQGGPISPVLANIMLHELDMELERRGHRFVRYADDMMIFCKSRKSAERTLMHIRTYIEKKLFLRLNEEKTQIRYIGHHEVKFLGFGFYRKAEEIRARPHAESQKRCKEKLKELTQRSKGQSLDQYRQKLKEYVVGWVNYFKVGDMRRFIEGVDKWLRRRIRQIYWKQWKSPKTREKALIKLGMSREDAKKYGNTRQSYWHTAKTKTLSYTLRNAKLKEFGWVCLGDVYRACTENCVLRDIG